jgi:rSAM/selenodomain-associated transferase 2
MAFFLVSDDIDEPPFPLFFLPIFSERVVLPNPPWLSIIIPVLNEAAAIKELLLAMKEWHAQGVELIVVDGGSSDATVMLATPLADRVLASKPGRAQQMNAGAEAAVGQLLWFVHADTFLSGSEWQTLQECRSHWQQGGWGRFDVRLSGEDWRLRMIASMMNLRSRVSAIATGDQGIFVSRSWFEKVGGFPLQPLMEDIEISRRLRRLGRPLCLRQVITTDSRRWRDRGVWRTIGLMWWLRLRYFFGADATQLHRSYYGAPARHD